MECETSAEMQALGVTEIETPLVADCVAGSFLATERGFTLAIDHAVWEKGTNASRNATCMTVAVAAVSPVQNLSVLPADVWILNAAVMENLMVDVPAADVPPPRIPSAATDIVQTATFEVADIEAQAKADAPDSDVLPSRIRADETDFVQTATFEISDTETDGAGGP